MNNHRKRAEVMPAEFEAASSISPLRSEVMVICKNSISTPKQKGIKAIRSK